MGVFAESLKEIRNRLGHQSGKKFFQFLKKRGFECNYTYYMKWENGQGVPSKELINQLAKLLPQNESQLLIKSFCVEFFPDFAHLFDGLSDLGEAKVATEVVAPVSAGQVEITARQIAVLQEHSLHYHIFVLCTLSRREIALKELEKYFVNLKIEKAIEKLKSENLIIESAKGIIAFAPDVKFPKSETAELKKAYQKFDIWDAEFSQVFQLASLTKKMMLRRISFRYLGLIQKQLELLFDLIRSADEIHNVHNDKVIHLKIELNQGKLPG